MYEVSDKLKITLQNLINTLSAASENSKNKLISVQKIQSEINMPLFISLIEYILSQFEEITNYINSNEQEEQDIEIGITNEQANDICNVIDICAAFILKISNIILSISDETLLRDDERNKISEEKDMIFKMINASKEAIEDMIISYEEDEESEIDSSSELKNDSDEYIPLIK